MMAVKQLYAFVKDKIAATAGINHFDWWNDNVLNDGTQKPYPTPAVFFELGFVSWEPSTAGSPKNLSSGVPEQQGQCEFTLHIIHKKTESSAVDAAEVAHLDEVQAVFEAIHFTGKDQAFIEGAIQRLRDDRVLTHNVLRDWPMTFSVNLFECALEDDTLVDVSPWTAILDIDAEPPYTEPGEGIVFNID